MANSNTNQAVPLEPSSGDERSSTTEQRRRELADFLRTRREKLKPDQVGLNQGARRRTPGLRREEVAELAGVGTTWYTWLEQARDIQPSSEVLRRLGQALKLGPAEMRHMFALAGKAAPFDLEAGQEVVTESMSRILNEALQVPAILVGGRWDILAVNKQAGERFPMLMELPENRRNWLYFIFCVSAPRTKIAQWEQNARRLIAEFRLSLSDALDNPWVVEIIDLLKAESPEFAKWWREHDVRENVPTIVEVEDMNGQKMVMERTVLSPWDNLRYKVIVLTPITR